MLAGSSGLPVSSFLTAQSCGLSRFASSPRVATPVRVVFFGKYRKHFLFVQVKESVLRLGHEKRRLKLTAAATQKQKDFTEFLN